MADQDQGNYGTTIEERLASPLSQWTAALEGFARSLRVALPATVVSFNAQKQTIQAQPAARELARVAGVLTIKDLPLLEDVPILLPRAGGFTLTMPVEKGDECLIVFADSSLDAWYQSGGAQNPIHTRRHALADGFAILAPWNQRRVLANYSTNSAQLRSDDGATVIDLTGSAVTVTTQNVTVNASGNANVQAQGTATVQGQTVNVSGSNAVNITGGHCVIDGKNFLTHTHTGVQTGGGMSGPVV